MSGSAAVPKALQIDRTQLQFDVAFRIVLASRRFRARFTERLKSHGQTDARWSALYILAEAPGGLIQSELAERMGIQGPTLVRLLDALEAQGLVKRHASAQDRRAKIVVIQPDGLSAVREVDAVAAQLRNEIFANLTDAELRTTLFVLDRLNETLDPANASMPGSRSPSHT